VEFDEENAAEKAKEKLDGRWFGGRRINASLFDLKNFKQEIILIDENSIVHSQNCIIHCYRIHRNA